MASEASMSTPVAFRTHFLPRRGSRRAVLTTLSIILSSTAFPFAHAYHRTPCKESTVRRQFQFSDCFAPNMNPDLPLRKASFVMAHDSATGYMTQKTPSWFKKDEDKSSSSSGNGSSNSGSDGGNSGNNYNVNGGNEYNNNYYHTTSNINQNTARYTTITRALLSLYGKTQVSTAYDQLNDGARALDLRPKIYTNGTVGFHHGSLIDVPLNRATLATVLKDAKKWCRDNPGELVLIFHSELSHEAGYNGLSSQVYMQSDEDDDYLDNTGNNYYDAGGDDVVTDDANDDAAADDGGGDDVYGDDANGDDGYQTTASYRYYYSGIATLKSVYKAHGVPYHPCEKVGGMTVAEAMELADLTQYTDSDGKAGQGYLLALDRHDVYASFCGKSNWVEGSLVTCYAPSSRYGIKNSNRNNYQNAEGKVDDQVDDQFDDYFSANNDKDDHQGDQRQRRRTTDSSRNRNFIQCTDRKNTGRLALSKLRSYVARSANNGATDSQYELGPPADSSYYPFNEIQALWQVDATSVQVGLAHASTLLEDNRKSQVNRKMVQMAYEGGFDAVSILALDNVALNGNAMFSVLRNACGQSVMSADMYEGDDDDSESGSKDGDDDNGENSAYNIYAEDDDEEVCGRELEIPLMDSSNALSVFWNVVMIVVYGGAFAWLVVTLFQAFASKPREYRGSAEDDDYSEDYTKGEMT